MLKRARELELPGSLEIDLRGYLDLVALGTVADVVPLSALNRALVAQGLKVAARRGNAGLAALAYKWLSLLSSPLMGVK